MEQHQNQRWQRARPLEREDFRRSGRFCHENPRITVRSVPRNRSARWRRKRVPDQLFYHLQSLVGILVLLGFAWAISENRREFPMRTVLAGLTLQLALALLLLKLPAARAALLSLNVVVNALTAATKAGTGFVFGYVGGGAPPFAVTNTGVLTNFAFQILPLVIVISA